MKRIMIWSSVALSLVVVGHCGRPRRLVRDVMDGEVIGLGSSRTSELCRP